MRRLSALNIFRFYSVNAENSRVITRKEPSVLNPFIGTGRNTPVVSGNGGRSSSADRIVTVFGATGFVGRYIVHLLAKHGNTVIIPFSGDEDEFAHLKPMGDLGRIVPIRFDLESPKQILDCVKDAHAVVNCIAREHDTLRYSMSQVNKEGAARIAQACSLTKVPKFLHLSNIRATLSSESEYLRSKAEGEIAVRSTLPSAHIIKSSVIFGNEDRFLNAIGSIHHLGLGFPVLKGHLHSQFYPIYVGDVAYAIRSIILDDDLPGGQTFAFRGPVRYDFFQLHDLFNRVILKPAKIRELNLFTYRLLGLIQLDWKRAQFKTDQIINLHENEPSINISDDIIPIHKIKGMKPLELLEEKAISFLRCFRDADDMELPVLSTKQ